MPRVRTNPKERHHIPMQDYDTLSMEQLVDELQILVNNDKVMSVKDHVRGNQESILKYNHFIEEKKRRIPLKP
jgi:PHD/YefM family antitoxin component YafN of YafNO toxin-antitoxin module